MLMLLLHCRLLPLVIGKTRRYVALRFTANCAYLAAYISHSVLNTMHHDLSSSLQQTLNKLHTIADETISYYHTTQLASSIFLQLTMFVQSGQAGFPELAALQRDFRSILVSYDNMEAQMHAEKDCHQKSDQDCVLHSDDQQDVRSDCATDGDRAVNLLPGKM